MAQQKRIRLASMRMQVQFLASISGVGTWRCHELWSRSQMWLGFRVAIAVVQASNCSSDWIPSLGTSICHGYCSKKQKKKKKSLEGTKSRTQEAEERIREVEDRLVEIRDVEQIKEKRLKRNEGSLREFWDNVKCINIRTVGVPEGEERTRENI